MERNFFRRVEVAFPIAAPPQRERILRDLETCARATTARPGDCCRDGSYERVDRGDAKPIDRRSRRCSTVYAAGLTRRSAQPARRARR